jgi:hypothetical protein
MTLPEPAASRASRWTECPHPFGLARVQSAVHPPARTPAPGEWPPCQRSAKPIACDGPQGRHRRGGRELDNRERGRQVSKATGVPVSLPDRREAAGRRRARARGPPRLSAAREAPPRCRAAAPLLIMYGLIRQLACSEPRGFGAYEEDGGRAGTCPPWCVAAMVR